MERAPQPQGTLTKLSFLFRAVPGGSLIVKIEHRDFTNLYSLLRLNPQLVTLGL